MANGSGHTHYSVNLTHRAIEALRPKEVAYRVTDARCIGLAIRVAMSGAKTWDLAYRIRGTSKVRRQSLGRFGDVSLEDARQRANTLTAAARMGRDLILEEVQARDALTRRITVERLIDQYVTRRVRGRLRTHKEIESRLRRALAPFLGRPAADIRRKDLRELFDACFDQGLKREAERRRQTVGAMFRWAVSQDVLDISPSAGLKPYEGGNLRNRVLDENEIDQLWRWLDTGVLPPNPADILRLQLLTGARCGEISGLRAAEVDLQTWTWTLPAERSKNGRPRVTPLVGLARDIVEKRLRDADGSAIFLAETGATLTSAHVGHFLLSRRDKLPMESFTTHDLRRTVATHLVTMGVSFELTAAVLGHEAGSKETRVLLRHYIRTDFLEKKRSALHDWDAKIRELVS